MDEPSPHDVQTRLLAWFDAGHRDMPWRRTKDPYRILLAEYLLQRTRVASGAPYYERFLERFPNVESLAAAPEEDVLRSWEGLGFYRRARNLHAAAKAIVQEHGGRIPGDATTLSALPGIGPYTAGAIASIAFGESVPAVDGNVTRVVTRLFRIEADVTRRAGRARVSEVARTLVPADRPGRFNQALMELGATLCTPRQPMCSDCPFANLCLARSAGLQSALPRVRPQRKPGVVAVSFALLRSRGRTLLVRRTDSELLGGLWSLPGGEIPSGQRGPVALRALVLSQTGLRVGVREKVARVSHTFSHRRWSGSVYRCILRGRADLSASARWLTADETRHLPLVPYHRRLLAELESPQPLESFHAPGRRRRG